MIVILDAYSRFPLEASSLIANSLGTPADRSLPSNVVGLGPASAGTRLMLSLHNLLHVLERIL